MEFSWADEVEREEEEAKVKRKANPFGDARPREVVLEEKGVDWRKLDRERDLHSILREDERTSKVNAHIRTASINKREQFPLAQRCEIKSCVQPGPRNTFVPPLKYPPKNIATLMQQIRKMDHNSKSNEYKPRNRYASKYPIPGQNARDAKKMVLESKDMVRGQRRVVLVDLNQHNNTEASRNTFDTFVMDHRRKNFKCVSHSTSSVADKNGEEFIEDTCDTFGSLADKVVIDSETMCNKKRGIHSASSVSVPRKRREGKHGRRCSKSMETFCAVVRYKGEGRMLQFTVLTSWETVLRDIGDRWALDVSRVMVKFVTPDSYKTLSSCVKYYLPV